MHFPKLLLIFCYEERLFITEILPTLSILSTLWIIFQLMQRDIKYSIIINCTS